MGNQTLVPRILDKGHTTRPQRHRYIDVANSMHQIHIPFISCLMTDPTHPSINRLIKSIRWKYVLVLTGLVCNLCQHCFTFLNGTLYVQLAE